ncbi:zinc finger hit domain-containing protein [Anaeramoeba flamelloides]|uniref:Zinc finger hit domain-containing protein n=1 Tax=Anaeramoeba flamelloides TaxID=1746091 RepID=A0ABQ8X1G4_9EUKA|nr:zinc finger hit domain-containing protein [Anaeramoeba flamelloides]
MLFGLYSNTRKTIRILCSLRVDCSIACFKKHQEKLCKERQELNLKKKQQEKEELLLIEKSQKQKQVSFSDSDEEYEPVPSEIFTKLKQSEKIQNYLRDERLQKIINDIMKEPKTSQQDQKLKQKLESDPDFKLFYSTIFQMIEEK